MAGYTGRRGVNVSQFLANGNALPSASDVAVESDPDYNGFEDDLARFTNVDFTDFDSGNLFGGEGPLELDGGQDESAKRRKVEGQEEHKVLDFVDGMFAPLTSPRGSFTTVPRRGCPPHGFELFSQRTFFNALANISLLAEFPFTGANPFALPSDPPSIPIQALPADYTAATTRSQSQTSPPATLPLTYSQPPYTTAPYPQSLTSPPATHATSIDLDESPAARFAAEEDKRRRNTAASARFRVKKKQREQALEKTAEELKQRAQELEAQVRTLQTENEWLKGLVVVRDSSVAKADAGRKVEEDRRETAGKEGVGTQADEYVEMA